MAQRINQSPSPSSEIIALDTANSDGVVFTSMLRDKGAVVLLKDDADAQRVLAAATTVRTIWLWRNTHDISADRFVSRLEAQLASRFHATRWLYQPYSPADRLMIRFFGWPDQPTHFYEILEMHPEGSK